MITPINRETMQWLDMLQTEIAVFQGYRQLWAEASANKRVLPLSREELEREQEKQIGTIAYAALCMHQSVYPGRSPHTHFVHKNTDIARHTWAAAAELAEMADFAEGSADERISDLIIELRRRANH